MSALQRTGLVAAILLVAAFIYLFLPQNDAEAIINARLDSLVEFLEKQQPETQFVSMGEGRRASRFFTENPSVNPGLRGTPRLTSRDQIAALVARVRIQADTIEIDATSRSLDIAETGDRAVMRLTGKATATVGPQTRTNRNRYELTWIKREGDWLIDRVAILQQ